MATAPVAFANSTLMGDGQLSAGASVSCTTTTCSAVLEFPWMSVAFQCTAVVPTGNVAGASLTTLATPQLSLVTGEPRFEIVALHDPGSVERVMFGGDWPVCTPRASLRQWVETLSELTRNRSAADRRKLFHDNAVKFYGLLPEGKQWKS